MIGKTKKAFGKVAKDMQRINAWILLLNGKQSEMKMMLRELERKVRKLEMERGPEV